MFSCPTRACATNTAKLQLGGRAVLFCVIREKPFIPLPVPTLAPQSLRSAPDSLCGLFLSLILLLNISPLPRSFILFRSVSLAHLAVSCPLCFRASLSPPVTFSLPPPSPTLSFPPSDPIPMNNLASCVQKQGQQHVRNTGNVAAHVAVSAFLINTTPII